MTDSFKVSQNNWGRISPEGSYVFVAINYWQVNILCSVGLQ